MKPKNKNQVMHDYQREKYMSHKITFQEFYLWLGRFIGANKTHLPCSTEEILNSTRESFNDIPLIRWDKRDPFIRQLAYSKGLAWSLSDTVCVLKAMAQEIKDNV